ncbi:FAD-dependent oxidoreductase [Marinovum sp.]|uniref:FAD-dependent oxidoreductase n=1 Tax=Marinovum sp. TaxID=2024839 RepID=UPI002B264B26|nr:FAD-dependent oxidoreductase [Marinovum sp.]
MSEGYDVIVVGAGPAGGEAALAAASAGLRVALVDEGPAPGGQVWRAPRTAQARAAAQTDADGRQGAALRARLQAASVDLLTGAEVWDAQPGFTLHCLTPEGNRPLSAPRVILATGAMERVLPFPGWTTPGVFGLAAATALLKSEHALPGREIVIAGQGPLLIAVAAKALALGLRPRAVVDRASRGDWLRAAAGFAAVPSMLARGAQWMARLSAARVPILRQSAVIAATGDPQLAAVTVRHLPSGRVQEIAADTLYLGNGLTPADELHRLLGAAQTRDALRGGYRTLVDADRRTSVAGLYAAGDGAGVHGALPSVLQGRIAGLAAARDHGALSAAEVAKQTAPARHELVRALRFADASCRLMAFPEAALAEVPPDAVVCRCEDVCRSEIDAAVARGAGDLNQLKHFTRLGMGPCQGRMCGLNAARLMHPEADLRLTPRAPVRPVSMDRLIGEFDYSDIPVPKPAPL